MPTTENREAGALSRPGEDELVRLRSEEFAELWTHFGGFSFDHGHGPARARSTSGVPQGCTQLPCFSRYA